MSKGVKRDAVIELSNLNSFHRKEIPGFRKNCSPLMFALDDIVNGHLWAHHMFMFVHVTYAGGCFMLERL